VKLQITAPAQRDIDKAAAEYFRERPILGADFLAEVDRALALLPGADFAPEYLYRAVAA